MCADKHLDPGERDNQCSVSFPVFFLIPQDKSVSAATPSLMLQFVYDYLFVSNPRHIHTPPCLSSSSPSFFLLFFFLLHSSLLPSLRTVVFTPRLVLLQQRMETCVSPSWLPQGCCGNNSCHFVVQKLTEKNEKRG